jgi:hypothetical protein
VVGKDFAGTVEVLGQGAEGFAVGDAVFGVVMRPYLGSGSLAEYVTVPAAYGVAHVPEGLGAQDAGALGLAGDRRLRERRMGEGYFPAPAQPVAAKPYKLLVQASRRSPKVAVATCAWGREGEIGPAPGPRRCHRPPRDGPA